MHSNARTTATADSPVSIAVTRRETYSDSTKFSSAQCDLGLFSPDVRPAWRPDSAHAGQRTGATGNRRGPSRYRRQFSGPIRRRIEPVAGHPALPRCLRLQVLLQVLPPVPLLVVRVLTYADASRVL